MDSLDTSVNVPHLIPALRVVFTLLDVLILIMTPICCTRGYRGLDKRLCVLRRKLWVMVRVHQAAEVSVYYVYAISVQW